MTTEGITMRQRGHRQQRLLAGKVIAHHRNRRHRAQNRGQQRRPDAYHHAVSGGLQQFARVKQRLVPAHRKAREGKTQRFVIVEGKDDQQQDRQV
jgi:hypothetical protein